VGSGIMAQRLAGTNLAIALLGNTIPTGSILVVLLLVFGPVSGAHFNPVVTLSFFARRQIGAREAGLFVLFQLLGAICGVLVAHMMFNLPLIDLSVRARHGPGQWFGEFVATFGLIATILGCLKHRPDALPVAVGLYITAAYWFTSSTSFANPAVTFARTLSDTFSGIDPAHVPPFILAQLAGALAATRVFGWLEEETA
ncbi:MAG TPA: aquaporin family protein, partial [Devosia sp.]|nr:aquaporin family protein [Devosia sp.]